MGNGWHAGVDGVSVATHPVNPPSRLQTRNHEKGWRTYGKTKRCFEKYGETKVEPWMTCLKGVVYYARGHGENLTNSKLTPTPHTFTATTGPAARRPTPTPAAAPPTPAAAPTTPPCKPCKPTGRGCRTHPTNVVATVLAKCITYDI